MIRRAGPGGPLFLFPARDRWQTSRLMDQNFKYSCKLRPLKVDEGGGWLIVFPDLPGCMSDGESPEEAIANGREIPRPGEMPSGKFVARIPRSLHVRLAARAKQEGVSMNALVSTFLAESLGRRESTEL